MTDYVITTQQLSNERRDTGRYAHSDFKWSYSGKRYLRIKSLSREEDAIAFAHAYIAQNGHSNTMETKEYILSCLSFTEWSSVAETNMVESLDEIDVAEYYRCD